MPARRLPFYAFVAHESDGSYVVDALCLVSGIWIAGTSKQERRQFAAKSWLTAASDICTLDLDLPRAATVDLRFAKSDFRYINTFNGHKPGHFAPLSPMRSNFIAICSTGKGRSTGKFAEATAS